MTYDTVLYHATSFRIPRNANNFFQKVAFASHPKKLKSVQAGNGENTEFHSSEYTDIQTSPMLYIDAQKNRTHATHVTKKLVQCFIRRNANTF